MMRAILLVGSLVWVSCFYQGIHATHSKAHKAKRIQQTVAASLEKSHAESSVELSTEKGEAQPDGITVQGIGTKAAGRKVEDQGTKSGGKRQVGHGTKRDGVDEGRPATILKSCNANFCDPGWEPYPNIVSAMTGYNILKGNAYNFGIEQDPGFDNGYIFVPVVKDDDDRYALHGGITVRALSKCDLTMKTKTVSTVKGFQNLNRGVDSSFEGWKTNPPLEISVDAKVVKASTELPPLYESYGTANNAQKENEEFFTKRHGILTISDATCAMYSMQISKRYPPPFQQPFKNAVIALSAIASNNARKQKAEFYRFIEDFGTHFLLKATIGARLSLLRRYHRDSFQQANSEEIEQCTKDRVAYWFIKEEGKEKCTGIENANNVRIFNELQREYIVSYGSKPLKSLTEWANQEFEYPVPIKMTLVPITELFNDNFMKNDDDLKNIGYNAMRQWMEPLYRSYCENMKSSLGIETCNPDSVKRCGYNDDCNAVFEDCFQKVDNEFECRLKIKRDSIIRRLTNVMDEIKEGMDAIAVAELIDESLVGKLQGGKAYVQVVNEDFGHLMVTGEDAAIVTKNKFSVAIAWANVNEIVGENREFKKVVNNAIKGKNLCNPKGNAISSTMNQIITSINENGYNVKFMILQTDEDGSINDQWARGGQEPDYSGSRSCSTASQAIMIGPGRKLP